MISNVACGNCGTQLAESQDLPIEHRQPCTKCGSTSRKFFVSVQVSANVEAKAEISLVPAYKTAGFEEVILTPRSGDYGRDIIAIKRGLGSIRVIDQVKAYKPDHLVSAEDVRALMGALQGDGASKGFLTTTSDFAPRLKSDPLIMPFIP